MHLPRNLERRAARDPRRISGFEIETDNRDYFSKFSRQSVFGRMSKYLSLSALLEGIKPNFPSSPGSLPSLGQGTTTAGDPAHGGYQLIWYQWFSVSGTDSSEPKV